MDATRRSPRDAIGRALLALAAVTAAAASVADLTGLAAVGDEHAMLAGWRALGLAVFAGVFALLAWRPRAYPGVFELAIGHKLAMTVYALGRLDTSTDAGTVAIADGTLTLALVAAYLLVRAHQGWTDTRQASTMAGAAAAHAGVVVHDRPSPAAQPDDVRRDRGRS